jgi:CRP-like cAMP-binding protein
MDITDFPALEHLNPTQAENLRAACAERELTAGEELIRRGTEGGMLYFLLEGSLQVYVEERGSRIVLSELHAPAVIGELELFTGKARTASVRALAQSVVLALEHERVQSRIDDGDPATLKAMYGIARVIAARLVAVTNKLIELEARPGLEHSHELRNFRQKLFSDWTV